MQVNLMIHVDEPILESWSPDFSSSGQPSPRWTRVRAGEWLLANSLEAPEWNENPVQVMVCEQCGYIHCASGGYVHVSLTAKHVAWTTPQIDESDPWTRDEYQAIHAVREHGLVLIPRPEWDTWAAGRHWTVPSSELAPLNGRALADAWRSQMPVRFRAATLQEVPRRVSEWGVACDPLTVPEAVGELQRIVDWLEGVSSTAVPGGFVHCAGLPMAAVTIYFDSAEFDHWPALASSFGAHALALSREWIFQPSAV